MIRALIACIIYLVTTYALSGCYESTTRTQARFVGELNGQPVDVAMDLGSKTKEGLDAATVAATARQAAQAVVGGALAELKGAIPGVDAIAKAVAVATAPKDTGFNDLLAGGLAAATAIAGGYGAMKHSQAKAERERAEFHRADADEAYGRLLPPAPRTPA